MPSPVTAAKIKTDRLETHYLRAGPAGAPTVALIHGNVSSSAFFAETAAALADAGYHVIAPDLRGFGGSQARPVDATRGVRDFSDDLHALFAALELRGGLHLVGWSVGGSVVMQYAIDHAADVASLTLQNPGSPFGFGGTRGPAGALCHDDGAGSGGGTANPEFAAMLAAGERGDASPVAPRNVMRAFYFKPPFAPAPEREEAYVSSMLSTVVGDGNYPGPMTTSAHWPGVAPGPTGMNNAISPKHLNLAGFADIDPKPPVLWIRGADDQIVSDRSMFDFAVLGELGLVPGWPGADVFPAQPMVAQTRHVLDLYRARGGAYTEVVFEGVGHSPHVEVPARFLEALTGFLPGAR
ncbi:MAG: alpha/beta hydrolase [Nannocystaceae bacterium]